MDDLEMLRALMQVTGKSESVFVTVHSGDQSRPRNASGHGSTHVVTYTHDEM